MSHLSRFRNPLACMAAAMSIFTAGIAIATSASAESSFDVERAAQALEMAQSIAPISSMDDLRTHLFLADQGTSPLHNLSGKALSRFIDSLVFTEYGLASWRYDDLVIELSEQQIYEVMQLFGRQYRTSLVSESLLTEDERTIREAVVTIYGEPVQSANQLRGLMASSGSDATPLWDCPMGDCEFCSTGMGCLYSPQTAECDSASCPVNWPDPPPGGGGGDPPPPWDPPPVVNPCLGIFCP